MKNSLLVVSMGLFVAVCSSSASAQKCLEYGPTVVLAGTLHRKVFAGPPNYESIKRGDRKETAIILKLTASKCTTGNDPMGYDIPHADIREMQLVIRKDTDWKTVRRRMGKRVIVTGTLFGAHTGHHRTKVLLDVTQIRAAQTAGLLRTYQPTRFAWRRPHSPADNADQKKMFILVRVLRVIYD